MKGVHSMAVRKVFVGTLFTAVAAIAVAACEQGGSNPVSPSATSVGSMAQMAARGGGGQGSDNGEKTRTRKGWCEELDQQPGNGSDGAGSGECNDPGGGGGGRNRVKTFDVTLFYESLRPSTDQEVVGTGTVTLYLDGLDGTDYDICVEAANLTGQPASLNISRWFIHTPWPVQWNGDFVFTAPREATCATYDPLGRYDPPDIEALAQELNNRSYALAVQYPYQDPNPDLPVQTRLAAGPF